MSVSVPVVPSAPSPSAGRAISARHERWMAWCGPVLIVLFIVGFGPVAAFLPPPSPHRDAASIAGFYADHETRIHVGLWIATIAAALFGPWVVAVTMRLRDIEGPRSPLAWVQLALGAAFVLEFILPLFIWQAADFRPGQSPDITYRLNDLGWLMFDGLVSTGVLEAVVIGLAILGDTREEPVLPRWLGYLNLWCAVLFLPGGLCVFFKTGPLAWNGLVAWWLLLVAFAVWVLGMSWALLRYSITNIRMTTVQTTKQ